MPITLRPIEPSCTKCEADVPRRGDFALVCVPPAQASAFWPLVEGFIEKSFASGTSDESPDDIRCALLKGHALLWIVIQEPYKTIVAAGTTQIVKTARGKICIFGNLGGEGMRDWFSFIADLEDYARAEGCKRARFYGRPGLERILRGYEKPWVTLEKAL